MSQTRYGRMLKDKKQMEQEFNLSLGFGVIFVGIILFIIAVTTYFSPFNVKEKSKASTTATIRTDTGDNGETEYYLKYTIDDETYSERFHPRTEYADGDTIPIYYDKENPYHYDLDANATKSRKSSFIFLTVVSIALFVGGIIICVKQTSNPDTDISYDNTLNVKETGKRIVANVTNMVTKKDDIFGTSYILICKYNNLTFESINLEFNPKPILEKYNIRTLPIYINPSNPEDEYYIDLDPIMAKKDL